MPEVAQATISVTPVLKGAQKSLTEQLTDEAGKAGNESGSALSKAFGTAAKAGAVAIGAASTAIAGFTKASISAGSEFDSAMSQVAATMGVTTGEITDLRDFAMEMGANTAFSATQAADALNYMALAGYDAETSMNMLPNVLNLAAAGGIDLASASDMVTDAQSALGLSLDQTTSMVDQMARASSLSNTSVSQLGEAILTVGGTAKTLSGGTTELSTALGILADNGIKGAEGGTHLRNILLSLQAPADTAATLLDALGVSAFDSNGEMRDLESVFGDLNDAMDGMSTADKQSMISGIFNKTDLSAVNALLSTSKDRWEDLGAAIDNSADAAQTMADTQLDNLAGDITLFQSALEGVQISISDQLTPVLRASIGTVTDVLSNLDIESLGDLVENVISGICDALTQIDLDAILDTTTTVISGIGEVISLAWDVISQVFDSLADGFDTITTALDDTGVSWDDVWSEVSEVVRTAGDVISKVISGVAEIIAWAIGEAQTEGTLINEICKNVSTAFEAAVSIISDLVDMVSAMLDGDWSAAWESAQNIVNTVLSAINTIAANMWNGLKNTASQLWSSIKTAITRPIESAKAALQSTWNGIKSSIEGTWNNIKTAATNTWNNIKTAVMTPIDSLKALLSGAWNSIWSTASGAWSNIKSAITGPIQSAKDTISGILDTIKGFFPLSIGKIFTNLKLPHITVSGGKAPFGIAGQGELPSFSVQWYAKAMDNPYMFSDATLFGAGERGDEILYGKQALMDDIRDAVGGNGTVINNYFTINGTENPEDYAARLARTLKLQMRMA